MWIIALAIVVGFALVAWVLDHRLSWLAREVDGILLTLVKLYDRTSTTDELRFPDR